MTLPTTSTNYAGDFGNCTVGETVSYFFDFTGQLAPVVSETIVSVTGGQWIASVAADSVALDPSAATIPSGAAQITGNVVGQKITGMVAGVKYLLQCFITTSQGNNLDLWAHVFCEVPI